MAKFILNFVVPETEETDVLYKILFALKINDIDLFYKKGILIAKDDCNVWVGEEFYLFLIDEAFVFNDDGTVLGIKDDLIEKFKKLCIEKGIDYPNR